MELKQRNRKKLYNILPIIFWIMVWQIASIKVNKEMLLASPFDVITALIKLASTKLFWSSILNSFLKIVIGFTLANITGVLLAILSYQYGFVKALLSPLIKTIKAVPVASFIILALLWVKSANLSILISFFMALPVIYANTLQGFLLTDKKLLEMAKVFRMKSWNKIKHIYVPQVTPYFVTACSVGIGFCWKSGIAAEVIGLPRNSIGEQLYEAKLYLMTKELFAWTLVIIIISVIFEKIVMWLINRLQIVLTKGNYKVKEGGDDSEHSAN